MTLRLAFSAYCGRRDTVPIVVALMTLVVAPGLAYAVVSLAVGDASGLPGADVFVAVTLTADGGEAVAAAENDITFDPRVISIGIDASGEPACTVNAAIDKSSTRFGFRPPGCDPLRGTCTAAHAVVIAIDNVAPIASGSLLYTCRFHISAAAAPGPYTLSSLNVLYAPPPGGDFDAVGVAGHITVLPPLEPPPTSTLTVMPTPTQPVATPTGTPGDVDCDGELAQHDIDATIGALFGEPANCPADCNGDGAVTVADLGCVAARMSGSANRLLEVTR